MKAKYRHCIFDFYGTLADIRTDEGKPALWKNLADYYRDRGACYTPEELHGAYLGLVRHFEEKLTVIRSDSHEAHPEIKIEKVFAALFEEKGISCSREEAVGAGRYFRAQSLDYLRRYPYTGQLLEHLREAGCKIWLLSNAQAIFTQYELDDLELTGYFDGIYLSSDYGCKKPSPEFYQILLKEQDIDPQTAVMIGNDGLCDIKGAQAAGLSTVYIHSNISPREELPRADLALPEMDLRKVEEYLLTGLQEG